MHETKRDTKRSDVTGAESLLFSRGSSAMKVPLVFSEIATRFLHRIRTETNDKIVLISNYTQTLDLFEKLCRIKG